MYHPFSAVDHQHMQAWSPMLQRNTTLPSVSILKGVESKHNSIKDGKQVHGT
jgi:hypothetical protein